MSIGLLPSASWWQQHASWNLYWKEWTKQELAHFLHFFSLLKIKYLMERFLTMEHKVSGLIIYCIIIWIWTWTCRETFIHLPLIFLKMNSYFFRQSRCSNGSYGPNVGRICGWLHCASDRCVCHAAKWNSKFTLKIVGRKFNL